MDDDLNGQNTVTDPTHMKRTSLYNEETCSKLIPKSGPGITISWSKSSLLASWWHSSWSCPVEPFDWISFLAVLPPIHDPANRPNGPPISVSPTIAPTLYLSISPHLLLADCLNCFSMETSGLGSKSCNNKLLLLCQKVAITPLVSSPNSYLALTVSPWTTFPAEEALLNPSLTPTATREAARPIKVANSGIHSSTPQCNCNSITHVQCNFLWSIKSLLNHTCKSSWVVL